MRARIVQLVRRWRQSARPMMPRVVDASAAAAPVERRRSHLMTTGSTTG
jgi:hypothetical protein